MCVCICNFDVNTTADLVSAHRGNFADSFGEDFLGLRALGIADEFGLSSLSVPKKLLRGKNKPKAGPEAYVYTLSSCLRPHIYTFLSFQCQAYRTSSSLPSPTSFHPSGFQKPRQPNWSPQTLLPTTYLRPRAHICTSTSTYSRTRYQWIPDTLPPCTSTSTCFPSSSRPRRRLTTNCAY